MSRGSVTSWLEHGDTEALTAEEPSDGDAAGSRRLGGREGGVSGMDLSLSINHTVCFRDLARYQSDSY